MNRKKSTSIKIRIIAFILICVITLCAQECDTRWMDDVAGVLIATGLILLGMDSQKAQEIGAGMAIIGLIIDTMRSTSTNYNPGISQGLMQIGITAHNDVIENRNRQAERQARIEETRAEHERQTQETIARLETTWTKDPINSSSITMNSSQNIGNPQVNPVVNTARVSTRQRDPRTGNNNVNQNRQLTGRNNQPVNPNVPSRSERADAGPGYRQTQQPTTRTVPSDGANSAASAPRPSAPVRSAAVPTPPASVRQESTIVQNSQAQAATIAQFTPRQSYNQVGQSSQALTNTSLGSNPTGSAGSSLPSANQQPQSVNPQQLSGAHWVNQFPTSTSISDLKSPFKENVQEFVSALIEAGADVLINATYRPQNRADLMHYSWRIANGQLDPRNVPIIQGVNIIWVHTDNNGNYSVEASIQAANNMVQSYGISTRLTDAPSRSSRHIDGLAIDMNISWSGNASIFVKDKSGQSIEVVKTLTDNVDLNPTLINIGRSYGVIKYHSPDNDPSHWSSDGR
jgi:hypothetical protein